MGLIGNKTLLHKLPLVQTGGTFASDIRVMDNWHCKENANPLTSIPSGYYKGWILPQFAGKISSYKNLDGNVNLNISVFKGLNINSNVTNSSDITIIATLITSILGDFSSTGEVNSNIQGILNASINLDNDSSLYTSMSALANILSNVLSNSSLNSDNVSLGSMSSDITSFSTLSPENLAIAVWNKLVAGSYSAKECMDILTAVAAGKTTIVSSIPGEALVTFKSIDDTNDKVQAEMINSERTLINIL
jgi:hypothetical protein